MIYQIKWGRIEYILKRRFSIETDSTYPVFYFENEETIYVYTKVKGCEVYASRPLSEFEKIEDWKMEFLSDAEELVSVPTEIKNTLAIKLE